MTATHEEIAARRQEANEAAIRVRTDPDPDPANQEWRDALARLGAALDYLQENDEVYVQAIQAGETWRRARSFEPDHADRVRAARHAMTGGKEDAFPVMTARLGMASDAELDLAVRIFSDGDDEGARPDIKVPEAANHWGRAVTAVEGGTVIDEIQGDGA
ncbi:hypothetical protein [Streptomyces sioyaensis]|uniref:hypothetical protein n=1 Tax=Streptomyces sioyaensis TaxID=67364 RepID=UPI003D74D23E